MSSEQGELPDDLAVGAWEDTAIVWMNHHPPRNLDLEEEHQDIVQVLSNWTDREPADIQPYWPQIKAEIVAAQGVFGVR